MDFDDKTVPTYDIRTDFVGATVVEPAQGCGEDAARWVIRRVTAVDGEPLRKVRAIQKTLKGLRRIYIRPTDERFVMREAAQNANDCHFVNPRPGATADAQDRWALRWLARYEAKIAETSSR